jgi:hypothetical protein
VRAAALFCLALIVSPGAVAAQQVDCSWRVTSPGPVNNFTGEFTTYMASPAGVMFAFTARGNAGMPAGSGMYSIVDYTGPGVYTAAGVPNDSAVGIFNLPDQGGSTVMLQAGNGHEVRRDGQLIGYEPLPPTLTVTNDSPQGIVGLLQGNFMDVLALTTTPPSVTTVTLQIEFTAMSMMAGARCLDPRDPPIN